MKKHILSWILVIVAITGVARAQGGRGKERMEAMKVGYITQKLNLTTEEAQRFWPVYNRFSDEMEKQRKVFRGRMMEELSDIEGMSDADADKALTEMINYKQSEVDLIKKYALEFKKVLPSQKVVQLFKAEQEFKKVILQKLKEERGR